MYYLLYFKSTDKFKNFAVQEFKALACLYGYSFEQIFKTEIEINNLEKINFSYELSETYFPNFPFVFVDIKNEDILSDILNRSIMLHRIIKVYAFSDNWETLKDNMDKEIINKEIYSEETYGFIVEASGKKYKKVEKVNLIESLPFENITGKCDLKNPKRVLAILELYKNGSDEKNKILNKLYFGRDLNDIYTMKKFSVSLELTNRIYLGPTSTDNDWAFLMANQAKVKKGDIIIDPFSGTGSLLVPCTYYGALCYGGEIDNRVIKGFAVGKINKKSSYYNEDIKNINVFTNFDQYKMNHPEIINMDTKVMKLGCKNFFDAIICDPPYGLRAAAKESGHKKPHEKLNYKNNWVLSTKKSEYDELLIGLYDLASRTLKINGRLVFLYPFTKPGSFLDKILLDDRFKLIDFSEDSLTKLRSRFLVTMEKVK